MRIGCQKLCCNETDTIFKEQTESLILHMESAILQNSF